MKRLNKQDIEDILPLTPMQEGMLFHHLRNPGSGYYFEQLCLEISGEIHREFFENAWNFVIETNEMLRTVFRWEKIENPIQVILKEHKLHPGYHDFSGRKAGDKKKCLEETKDRDRKTTFNLQDAAFRVTLCQVEKRKYLVIISNHHILYDGWSTGIILGEFFKAYNDLSGGKELIKPVKTKFKEFIKWHQTRDRDAAKEEEFWKEYLKGPDPRTGPPNKEKRKRREITSTGHYQFTPAKDKKEEWDSFVKVNKITLASLLYTAWGLLLQGYNNRGDVVFDTTASGRDVKIKGIENIVGLFINTLPLRVQARPGEKIAAVLTEMHEMLQQRRKFEHSSPMLVKEYMDRPHTRGLFDSVVVIENYPLDKIPMQGDTPSPLTVNGFSNTGMTGFDLTVIITLFEDITIDFTYNKDLFYEEDLEKLADRFSEILRRMIKNPFREVSGPAIVPAEMREKLLERYKENFSQSPVDREYFSPGDPIEEKLSLLWSELFGVDKSAIGIDANFFDFGGHSLKASLLAARIRGEFRVKVPLTEIFMRPTIRELSAYIKETAGEDLEYESIKPLEKKEYYLLSSAQRRIFMHQQVHRESTAYNSLWAVELAGKPDKYLMEKAFKHLIARHESLRTSFILVKQAPVQEIAEPGELDFKIEYYDTGQEKEWILEQISTRTFDLGNAPLMRVGLIKTGRNKHIFMVGIHHIITDGVSTGILIREFFSLYKGETLPRLKVQYKDFSQWQNQQLKSGKLKSQEKFWLNHFPGTPPVLNMPTDFPRPAIQNLEGDTITFRLENGLHEDLILLMKKTGTTLYMVLLSILTILLYKYTDRQDIIIGSPLAGRYHPDLERMVGLVVETLVTRNRLSGEKTFEGYLKEVKENTLAAYENQSYPYGELIGQLALKKDLSRNPLFDVMLNVRDREKFDYITGELRLIPLEFERKVSRCDLILEAVESEESVTFQLEYCSRLFKRETIERFSGFFVNIMKTVVKNPEVQISRLGMLSEEEELQNSRNQIPGNRLAADFDF